ncbi:ribonuclease PH [Pseudoramibacter sp.]|uniref:ribonuclease PH n=1 Tax=Pseudoramibacter sp. TaxID=2034862 RepID=UPI0025EBF7BF|nr:ribonuclease PH [Pseudoramibacter sp.]MCH4072842.1 ribonuclease PH [Pseudoramibacter sp.]MCH4106613.1 ribonuclease PH [Pseudoramibacter sp.]
MRKDGRSFDEGRPVYIKRHVTKYAPGSVLIKTGDTAVLCTAMIDETVPPFMRGEGRGWVTAEYSMLPSSTQTRKKRDRNGKTDSRSIEIQRLIGRSLRSIVDLNKLGERTIKIDCDVIQADGGTRTASITGSFVALYDAVQFLLEKELILANPITSFVASVSVGIYQETPILDLCYDEDSNAIVDMNVVMTEKGEFIEIQGTGEARPFTNDELLALLSLAKKGILNLISNQKDALGIE